MNIQLYKFDEASEKLNLLKMIRKSGISTRGQIVGHTGYSSAKIGILIKDLEESGLIIFNPQAVVLAGGIANAGELLLEPVRQAVKASALEISSRNCDILISNLDEYSASLGMANICIDNTLESSVSAAGLMS